MNIIPASTPNRMMRDHYPRALGPALGSVRIPGAIGMPSNLEAGDSTWSHRDTSSLVCCSVVTCPLIVHHVV